MEMKQRLVNTPVMKKDAMALVTGQPVYTEDLAPKDCLIVKVLRSPHAHALIEEINTAAALKVPDITGIYTYEDVPEKRFTMAGQTYPEPSPYDRLILDQRVRFVGDAVAIVAGETEKAVDRAMRLIKVKYQVCEPVLDFHKAKGNDILVHPEENWKSLCPVGADNKQNLCARASDEHGDVEGVLEKCRYRVEQTYHTKANQQAMMETFRTFTYMDVYGRLNIVSSTQVTFHVRRILSHALDIPKSKIRVIKPRIGGGFGAKQTVVAEVYPAFVTMQTGRAAKIIYSRYESQIAATDIAARGIDVDHLTHVINYELPNVPETYVHRIGRTGRAGREGVAFSFCDAEEVPLLKDIQKLIGKEVPVAGGHMYETKEVKAAVAEKKEAIKQESKRRNMFGSKRDGSYWRNKKRAANSSK